MPTNAIDASYKPSYYAQAKNIVSSSGNDGENVSIYQEQETGSKATVDMDYVCTDGKDDGKLSTGEAIESVGKGIGKSLINMVKMPFTEAAKGNFLPAIAVVAGAALCATPIGAPLAVIGGAMGIGKGLFDIGSGLAKASEIANSGEGTDGEAKAALEGVGSGILTTGLSAVAVAGGVKTMKARGGEMAKLEKGAKFGNKVKAFKDDTKDAFGKLTSKTKSSTTTETPENTEPTVTDTHGGTGKPTADASETSTVKIFGGKKVDISGTSKLTTQNTRSLKRWDKNHGTNFLQQYIENYTKVHGIAPKNL